MWQTMGKFSPAKELNKLTFPLLVQKNKNKNKNPKKTQKQQQNKNQPKQQKT